MVVQNSIGGNTTYSSPSFPLTVFTNGNVTIIVYWHNACSAGTEKLYQENLSGGWDLIDSESYQPPYLSPVGYTSGDSPNYTVYYEFRIY